ncbi:MAG: hypothetical protein ABIH99_04840 [Candidatus Micrarchaeota archaeon]
MTILRELIGKKFMVTGEVAPPRGTNLAKLRKEIRESPLEILNVIDNPGSRMLLSSLGGSLVVKEE